MGSLKANMGGYLRGRDVRLDADGRSDEPGPPKRREFDVEGRRDGRGGRDPGNRSEVGPGRVQGSCFLN